ncbi:MAG TPA: 6-hydroxymethylpterin diphosphokinase MptE-like protein, partial [Stellaceae bacterium]|nr:6-hydroxymethylpterin diphosphokinase MptE-like protein [Stellaceae bacterium]
VGAGPSLDEGLETIRAIRDRIVLFSCGTALRPLLRAGIVPDFQCELENVPAVHTAITEAGRFGDLSAITLVASATVDPRVPPLFRDAIFYFRDSVSSTAILGRRHRLIAGTAPTCVNMGLAMAGAMGFTEFVLFGTDCGVRPGANRHAEGTVYRDLGVWREKDQNSAYSLEVEGNFGGTVRTDWIYDACRLMLAGAIAHYRFNVVNCSDGALIPGARPCVPGALRLASPPVDRAAFMADLRQSMASFAPGALLEATDLGAVRRDARRLFEDVGSALDELRSDGNDFADAYRRVGALAAEFGDRYAQANALIDGALRALPRIGMFFGFRVADAAARARLYRVFIDEFRAIVADMADRTEALFAELAPSFRPAKPGRQASGE